jgi:O-antigen/teichoic acid export membrane protein
MFGKINKNSTGSMILFLGSSQMISNVIRIVSGLLIAKLVLPQTLGLFNGYGLILGYLPILQVGVMNGLNRELPYLFGKNKPEQANKIAAVAQFWELGLAILVSTVLIILATIQLSHGHYIQAAGYFTYALVSFHKFYGINYLHILFRSNSDFNKLSVITLVVALFSLVLILPVWLWGFYGLGLRLILVSLIEFGLLWEFKPLIVKPRFETVVFKEIVKVGFPIYVVGYVFALWTVIQNTIVFKYGGSQQYGFFSLSIMVQASLAILIGAVTSVLYPKLAFEFGKGATVKTLLQLSFKPVFIVFAILVPSVIILWYLLPIVVTIWLPKYIGGIQAAQWTLLTLLISVFGTFNVIFNVVKRQKDYLISIVAGIVSYLGMIYSLYSIHGFTLVMFPKAMMVGLFVQIVISFIYLNSYRTKPIITP